MYTRDNQEKFIELRAQGWSLSHIASHLHVSKSTLVDWSREFAPHIQTLRTAGLDLLHEKVVASRDEEMSRLLRFQKDIEDELGSRSLSCVPLEKLFQIACDLRKEIKQSLLNRQAEEQPSPARDSEEPGNGSIERTSCRPAPLSHNGGHRRNGTVSPRSSCPNGQSDGSQTQARVLDLPDAPVLVERSTAPAETTPATSSDANEENDLPYEADPDSSTPSPAASNSVVPPSSEAKNQKNGDQPQEHCLACGVELPPVLPTGHRPSHYCECGQSLSLPGLSLLERCFHCAALLPPHGYNAQRPSDTCPACAATLPPLDPKAIAPWIPKHMRTNLKIPGQP